MPFPESRPRRLRRTSALRRLVAESDLMARQLILPLFVRAGFGVRTPVPSMPGVSQLSTDEVLRECERAQRSGIGGVLLFGIPEEKDESGSSGWDRNGAVQQAVRAIKREFSDLVVITDVCMCEYTSHGHCGIVTQRDGHVEVDNDATLPLLARVALSHAESGADIVAPSDMMDGRVGFLRRALDDGGHSNTTIMSYAAKFASAHYGPFREAAESAPQSGDRHGYQMDSRNSREALRELRLDEEEGADIIMVKPAGPALDIIALFRANTSLPVAAYQVSGEYAMIQAAAERGWINGPAVMLESLRAIRRAGADIIISYFALDAAELL